MSNLSARLDAAAEEKPSTSWRATCWQPILEEFVAWLDRKYSDALRASLLNGSAPDVHYVRIWPVGQRNSAFTLLTVHATEQRISILGKDSPEFTDEETFSHHLEQFVQLPAFKNTIASLREIANQPVDGVLRVGATWQARIIADIKVGLAPEQQRLLASAAEAEPPRKIDRLRVFQARPTAFERGTYPSPQHPPQWLVAGGYVLAIDEHGLEPDGSTIWLSGRPISGREPG